MDKGFYIVDSVAAVYPGWKNNAVGWTKNVMAAFALAEHETDIQGGDFIVLDHEGHVV